MNEWIWNVKTMFARDAVLTISRRGGESNYRFEPEGFHDGEPPIPRQAWNWHVKLHFAALTAHGTAASETEAIARCEAATRALVKAASIINGGPLEDAP
jgi:hypothetical protein